MKLYFPYFLAAILIGITSVTYAQTAKEGSIWYFEGGKGVDFNFTPPKPLSDGRVFWEGKASSICDGNGDLMFYSSGDSVWTRQHQPMVNGFGLNGADFPIYTPSVIVPHPGDGQLYYIFKTNKEHDGLPATGLHYAVVDMSGDGGSGEVIYKKHNFIPVTAPFTTVTLDADEKMYWVISHGWENNQFYAVHVTTSTVEEPVISEIGNIYGELSGIHGQMKISPDGTKLAVTQSGKYYEDFHIGGFVHLYDFNPKTGSITNFRELNVLSTGGVEFSPNSELLYVSVISQAPFSSHPGVVQLDISSGITEEINNSIVQIGFRHHIGELQLGPDGKIYCANLAAQWSRYLAVISDPNTLGVSCNFDDSDIELNVLGGSRQHLPLFVQSIFRESPIIPEEIGCIGIPSEVRITSLGYSDSLEWDFGDGIQESFPSSTGKIVNHVYEQTGEYELSVKKYIGNLSRELVSKITIIGKPVVNIGADTILCRGDKLRLEGGNDGIKFTWSTGESTQQIEVRDENQYVVIVDNGTCTTSDNISVQVYDYPVFELGSDKIICDRESVTLDAEADPNFRYQWNTGSTSQEITITETGLYELAVSHGRCETTDQIHVQFGQIIFSLSDSVIEVPFGKELHLEAIGTNMELWHWNFGDKSSDNTTSAVGKHRYLKSGEYEGQVVVTNQYGCSADASFYVKVPEYLFIPNVITPNNDAKNELFEIQYNGDEQPNLMIYDRWGKMVFNSQSFESKWSAEGSDSGVYFYQLKLGRESFKGWIHVIK